MLKWRDMLNADGSNFEMCVYSTFIIVLIRPLANSPLVERSRRSWLGAGVDGDERNDE